MQYVRADSNSAEDAVGELEAAEMGPDLEKWRCCWDPGRHLLLPGFM